MSLMLHSAGLLRMWKKLSSILIPMVLAAGPAATADLQARPAVLELFTSEGCSSCPPAEGIVNELAEHSDVLALSFHVDYWDGLGWRDHYSLAEATERQRRYAHALRLSSVYTPQVVVDGSREMVGSRREAVTQAVSTRRDGVPISLSVEAGTVQVRIGAGAGETSADVLLLGYLRQATTHIGRGENSGLTINESNIVRVINKLGHWNGKPQEFQANVSTLPAEVTDLAVIVQLVGQGAIVGAAAKSMH